MRRVFLSKRFVGALAELAPEQKAKAERILREVSEGFGDPPRHGGFGLRKLSQDFYECRLDLRLRIVLYSRPDGLLAYDIMSHDQVRALLRGS